MNRQHTSHSRLTWQTLPLIHLLIAEWQDWRKERTKPRYRLAPLAHDSSGLPFYPIDMEPLLTMPFGYLDQAGVLYNAPNASASGAYQPTSIAQFALAQWDAYLTTRDEQHKQVFLTQAHWLVQHGEAIGDDSSGWLIPFPSPKYNVAKPWLSALTQGNCISVLVRAYRLTGEESFLQVARRAVHTFELDIRDNGVSASVGDDGIFFEEVAAYPAAHILNGYLLALFGLYDYVALTDDAAIKVLIQRSLVTLHTFIDELDLGYWSCYDWLFQNPASQFYHALHVVLLQALANYSGCDHCAMLASRWEAYQQSFLCNLRYFNSSRVSSYRSAIPRKLSYICRSSVKTVTRQLHLYHYQPQKQLARMAKRSYTPSQEISSHE